MQPTFDEKGHTSGVLHFLDECVLLLAQCMLIHQPGPAKIFRFEIFNRVLCDPTGNQLQPLHIPPLCPPQRHDPVLDKYVQGHRVDPLLIDHDKILRFVTAFDVPIAYQVFEFDDLLQFCIDELAF
jgi:hypothetical protein